jgi:hypothetical protein
LHYSFSVIDINRVRFFPKGKQISRKDCFDNLTRFISRMDLFEYIIRYYVQKRGWDCETAVKEAIAIKKLHDKQWQRRKALLRRFKKSA